MRPDRYVPSPALLLMAFVPMAMAQDNKNTDKPSPKPADNPTNKPADAKPNPSPSPNTNKDAPPPAPSSSSSSADKKPAPAPSSTSALSLPATNSVAPAVTNSLGLPALTGIGAAAPTYPPASVPPTKNAPFMQQSSAPEGTVFIAVGAVLGAFGVAILLWRAIVSLLLHRSVERATMAQHDRDTKSGFPAPPAPFYKYSDRDSSPSFGPAGSSTGRGTRRTNRGPIPSANLSQGNLFFSPTAVTGNAGANNRASGFLPSGFYAAGSATPGSQSANNGISMSNLRPDSRGHYVATRPSPPGSPAMSASRGDLNQSTASLSMPLAPGQRAPSAYLEDLLADDASGVPPMPSGQGSHGIAPTRR